MARGITPRYHDKSICEPDCGTIFFDDFAGGWKLEDLINLMEGNIMINPKMERNHDLKFKNIQVIFITSYYPLPRFSCYWNEDAFKSRINLVSISDLHKFGIDLKTIE